MAYEVVKEIRGHLYRYSVESFRDPDTGKVRNRWTYLGRARGPKSVKSRSADRSTREQLIGAFIKLIERKSLREVTPPQIAREAGVSSATFYRYFGSRDELLLECTKRATVELDRRLAELHALAPDAAAERAHLRDLAVNLVRMPPASPGLFRAWMSLGPEPVREARHAQRIAAFSEYISELQQRGFIAPQAEPRRLAIALSIIVQMFTRRSVIENKLLSEEDYAVVAEVFDRLIFLSN